MTPEPPVIAELRPLMDAFCEGTITAEQLRRLEELVLAHREAEDYYVQFMSFYADLIGCAVGLPEPTAPATPEPRPAEEKPVSTQPATPQRPASRSWSRWVVAAAVLLAVGAVGAPAAYQYAEWSDKARAAREAQAAADARRNELGELQTRLAAAREQSQRALLQAATAARAAEQEYAAALQKAHQAIKDRDFVVRLTGPAHVQPGAPNKWQIETLRHGAVARPKKLDVVVKDEKDAELLKQSHDRPVGVATLELPAGFWAKVKPGADLFLEVVAYTDDDRKSVLAERVPLARPVYVTHLVTDKPLYKPGETVRFRSLTLDRSSLRPPEQDTHLKFRLRDPGDAVIPLGEGNGRVLVGTQPVIGPDRRPVRGVGVGEFTLGSDAAGGEYKLDLFETVRETGREVLLETRKFIVNRYVPDVFEKKLEFDGKSYGPGDVVQARIEVSRTAGGPMKDAKAVVVAGADGRTIHELKDQKFALVTEGSTTKAVLNVRFKLPADLFDKAPKKDVPPNATLSVNIADGSDAEAIVRPIPLVTKNLAVEFFPEGGDLIEGVPGRVYFQVRTAHGKPADLKGHITDGAGNVVEVATLTDAEHEGVNRGHGVFTLTPKPGTKYFLKIATPTGIIEPTKDGFPLPTAKADGVALTALDTVTDKGGAIRVKLHAATGPKTLHVGAYARGRLIAHQKLDVEAGKPVEVSLKGDDTAGGVTRITVFEEPRGEAPGRAQLVPRAERLVYRKPGEQLTVSVTPDKTRYTPAGKVRLEVAAVNEQQKPTPAVLLVGVVNSSVIRMADNKTDRLLPTHVLLSGEVKHPAELEHADFLLTDHPKAGVALDLLLGTQGWRRFAEQTGAAADAADRADVDRMLVAHGQRTTAPVELYKLEEQRVAAEFGPKLEQAHIVLATAQSSVNQGGGGDPGLAAKAASASAAAITADIERARASAALTGHKERLGELGAKAARVLLVALVLVGLFLLVKTALIRSATKPVGSRRPYFVGGGIVAVCGLLLLAVSVYMADTNATAARIQREGAAHGGVAMMDAGGAQNMPAPRAPWIQKIREFEAVGADRGLAEFAAVPAAPPGAMGGSGGVAPPSGPRVGSGFVGRSGSPAKQPAPNMDPRPGNRPMVAASSADGRKQLEDALRGRGRGMGGFGGGIGGIGGINGGIGGGIGGIGGGGIGGFPGAGGGAGMMPGPGGPGMGFGAGRAPGGLPNDPFGDDPARLPAVLPFVVREYAHQRDPALGEVRADFTETVFWHPVLVLPEAGKTTVEFQLSDDIARYQVLVAGHTTDGRIGAVTKTIEARKPFSLDPKLPLEISHTDTVDVPVRVTNDSDDPRTVTFTVTPHGLKADGGLQGTIDLAANKSGRKVFRMKSDQLQGDAAVAIAGASKGADGDSIQRVIRVVPDGFPGVGSVSDMIEGRARGGVRLPKDLVPGTLKVRLEVYPTSMADLVKGLDGLLREPHGCFEQTSTTNYPNTLILDYLNQSNQANPDTARRAKELLDRGYARLTTFECPDTPGKVKHGFEWFGAADMQHEALTAYGLLQFKDMARVHQVDPELIKRTQAFLLSRRDGTGGFRQNPRALHSWGASKQVVNAYIVWALVESDPDDAERMDLRKEIDALKVEALNEGSAGGKDAYFVALVANVLLHRGDREAAHRLLDRLQEKHAKDGPVTGAVTSVTSSRGRDLEIETTALALLGWLRANDPKYATTVKAATKWISQQRGGYGGFGSTQSTIMALKALTLHAKKSARPAEAGDLKVLVGGKEVAARRFTEQDVEVIGLDVPNPEAVLKPGERTEVEIVTSAKQPYPFALSYAYTTLTPVSAEKCAVSLNTKLARTTATEGETVPLSVTLENRVKQGHGMAVAVIGLPAGMKVPTDMKQLTDLREKGTISYFELRGREVILYWRELAPEQKVALSIDLVCDVPGVYRGPASRGYLYYDADHKHWVEPLAVTIAPLAGEAEAK